MAQITPSEAKELGRKIQLPHNWSDIRLGVMTAVVYQKFLQNPDAQSKLLATGDAYLQEGNTWGDTFWGTDLMGNGENHLGKILMAVRKKLREDANR